MSELKTNKIRIGGIDYEIEDTKARELIKNLKNAQIEFETAVNNYEFANDPELVDYYTYNIKATQTRYQYLLKKAKEKGL